MPHQVWMCNLGGKGRDQDAEMTGMLTSTTEKVQTHSSYRLLLADWIPTVNSCYFPPPAELLAKAAMSDNFYTHFYFLPAHSNYFSWLNNMSALQCIKYSNLLFRLPTFPHSY